MSSDSHRFVFICGLHRSGTSLLHRCLRDHPDISGFANTNATEDEGQHLQSVYPPDYEFGPVNRFGFDSAAHLDESSPLATPENARRLFEQWSRHWDLTKPVLIEKSPPNLLRTRFFQSLFPRSYFIVILRHPVAVSFATMKWNAGRIDRLLEHWVTCHERFERDHRCLRNAYVLKYESFVKQPEEALSKIYSFIGLDFAPSKQSIKSDLNEKYFEMWRRRPIGRYNHPPLRQLARLYFRVRFEKRVNRFGYSLVDFSKH